ncbi:DUF2088 domain-containing protein [Candidatus Thorarchaeota archaeon]|nr:MAG: DUF2088 domain-containing protein [Candidatus Thorarchaeota archaeon]
MGQFYMRFNLQYGDGSLPLEINNRLKVETIQPQVIVDISDIDLVLASLEKEETTIPLSKLAKQVQSATIVINGEMDNDITATLLAAVLDSLKTQMLRPENIAILCQEPTSAPKQRPKLIDLLGSLVDLGHPLIAHDPKASDTLHFVGDTPTHCTPVYVNKAYSEAELKIGVGEIRADVFVGATGGRMSVLPWAAGIRSIERNVKLRATHPVGPFMHETATCIDLEEASRLAGLDYIVNAVPDCCNHVAQITAGEPYISWRESIATVRSVTETTIKTKADITFISAGSPHHDRTLYDAIDSLYSAAQATEQGGVIILVAECPEGVGPAGFMRGLSECTSESEVAILSETGFDIGMAKARLFWNVMKSWTIIICSRLRASVVSEHLHCHAVRDPQEGLELARSLIVTLPRIAIIPLGMRTIPILKT